MHGRASQFTRRLLQWYDQHCRDLPWRARPGSRRRLDPWHVLVSEAMLQQTQVTTVVPYFLRFIERFPTVGALAAASEQEVLRLWQGLGYYSRARNLHHAARQIMKDHRGEVPRTIHELLALPGIGRYTAGAIASIAFDCRAPIVDGNVARVLCRLDGIQTDPREKSTRQQLWQRAEQVLPTSRCGDFNSALMELGATVCVPRSPRCRLCPVQPNCQANRAGLAEQIPVPKKSRTIPLLKRDVLCLRSSDGKYLIEQRPSKGRWASMWQFPTIESGHMRDMPDRMRELGDSHQGFSDFQRIGMLRHQLTHRRYQFRIFHAQLGENPEETGAAPRRARKWGRLDELDHLPMPGPHVKIVHMLSKTL